MIHKSRPRHDPTHSTAFVTPTIARAPCPAARARQYNALRSADDARRRGGDRIQEDAPDRERRDRVAEVCPPWRHGWNARGGARSIFDTRGMACARVARWSWRARPSGVGGAGRTPRRGSSTRCSTQRPSRRCAARSPLSTGSCSSGGGTGCRSSTTSSCSARSCVSRSVALLGSLRTAPLSPLQGLSRSRVAGGRPPSSRPRHRHPPPTRPHSSISLNRRRDDGASWPRTHT